jgi:hypothetical protein
VPVSYTLENDGRLAVLAATGVVTPREFVDLANALLADPALKDGAAILVDRTSADPRMTSADLWQTAMGVRGLVGRGIRRVAIAATDDAAFGVSRAFEVPAAAVGLHVFVCRSMEEARAWITAT